jgi:hypothetical protein
MGGHLVPVDGPAVPDDRRAPDEQQGQLRRGRRRKIRPKEVSVMVLNLLWLGAHSVKKLSAHEN